MSTLYLVRHGEPAAGWDAEPDPGLSARGHEQAAALVEALPRLPLFASPLRRTRETAAPLSAAWGIEPTVEPGVGEIVTPPLEVAERSGWLGAILAARWADLGESERRWRQSVLGTFAAIARGGDAVVVTHFVAINVALGARQHDDRVTVTHPAHCSVTPITL